MTTPDSDFAFQKELGVSESIYGNANAIRDAFFRILYCMEETNKLHGVSSEYFRLEFRPQSIDEQITRKFPVGALVLDLKWGSKRDLQEKKNDNA